MSKNRECFNRRKIPSFIVILFSVVMILINTMYVLGCIGFSSPNLKCSLFGYFLLLCLIVIYESNNIPDEIKFFSMGVLCGTILFVHEDFFLLWILFIVNIMWSKISSMHSIQSAIADIAKVVFWSMFMLEIYSVCVLYNEFLYKKMLETSVLFKMLDIFFLLAIIMYVVFNCKKEESLAEDEKQKIKRKKRYVEIARLSVWCVLVFLVLFTIIIELCLEIENSSNGIIFYLGKTIDGGYLLCNDGNIEQIFYATKIETTLGGVIENRSSYQLVLLESGFYVQKFLLYVVKYVCQFFYGIYSVLVLSALTMGVLVHRFIMCKRKIKKNRG